MTRRTPIVAASAVLLAAAALAPAASADVGATRSLKTAAPEPGQVAVLATDVVATNGGAPGALRIKFVSAASVRPRLKVVMTQTKLGRRVRVLVYAALTPTRGASAAVAQNLTVTIRGVKKAVSLRNAQKVKAALPALTGAAQSLVCGGGTQPDETKGLLGVSDKKAAGALARILRRVLCGSPAEGDLQELSRMGIGIGNLACRADFDNPFWGVCTYTGPPFRHLRLRPSAGNAIVECFAGANPCVVEPGNSVRYDFDSSRQDSGEISLRSSNQRYADWGPLQIFTTDGEVTSTFSDGPSFDPQ